MTEKPEPREIIARVLAHVQHSGLRDRDIETVADAIFSALDEAEYTVVPKVTVRTFDAAALDVSRVNAELLQDVRTAIAELKAAVERAGSEALTSTDEIGPRWVGFEEIGSPYVEQQDVNSGCWRHRLMSSDGETVSEWFEGRAPKHRAEDEG